MNIQSILDEISDLTSDHEGIPREFAHLLVKVIKAADEVRRCIDFSHELHGSTKELRFAVKWWDELTREDT